MIGLFSYPLHSQEAECALISADLSVIPTFDGVLGASMGGEQNCNFNLGNTSIYSLLEGNLKNLTYSMAFHWVSFGLNEGKFDPSSFSDLYSHSGRSDSFTWLDWAYLGWEKNNFSVNLGKCTLFGCGMEGDDYDWDIHPTLVSTRWNNFQPYQLAAEAYYTTKSDNTTFGLQAATSPYGKYPFESGLYSFAFCWLGEYGPVRNNWAFSYIDTGDGYYPLFSLGQAVDITDNLSIVLDYWNAVCDPENLLTKGHSAYLSALWSPFEKWEIKAIGGAEFCDYALSGNLQGKYLGGFVLHWFPIDGLRLHCSFASNQMQENSIYATIGIQCKLNLHIGK